MRISAVESCGLVRQNRANWCGRIVRIGVAESCELVQVDTNMTSSFDNYGRNSISQRALLTTQTRNTGLCSSVQWNYAGQRSKF